MQCLPASVFGHALTGGRFLYWGFLISKHYSKAPKSYEELADLLLSRGMLGERDLLINTLKTINYYRLSIYWYSFREKESDNLQKGTLFTTVINLYQFDADLRSFVFSILQPIELALRNKIVHAHVMSYGASGYLNIDNFPGFERKKHAHNRLLSKIYNGYLQEHEIFIKHYKSEYGFYIDYPLWMACEGFTFGNILSLYQGLDKSLRKEVAEELLIPQVVLENWIRCLGYIRNLCAHHNRLWNRRLALSPVVPKKQKQSGKPEHPEWYVPVVVAPHKNNMRLFVALTVMKYISNLYNVNSNFTGELVVLLSNYPSIPIEKMGFPENWLDCPIWLA